MSYGRYGMSLEEQVYGADPLQLVQMLYEAATSAVRDARRCLYDNDIAGRSRSISKAVDIIVELMTSLDHEKGSELSAQLAELYDYMQRQLLRANVEQIEAPLAEVESLLVTLDSAWREIGGTTQAAQSEWVPAVNEHQSFCYSY
jgi:flagellar protein FliS